jgi:hypothetical protein
MDNRIERVVLETDRYRVVGDLTLPREGFRSRLSDYLNRHDLTFVPLVEVELTPLDGGAGHERRFIAVARDHVQLAYPAAEGRNGNGATPD